MFNLNDRKQDNKNSTHNSASIDNRVETNDT